MNHDILQLGAIPLSSDILYKANIGLWAFEIDDGLAPRMYVDAAMLKLIGLDHQLSPEETYHAWYDNIDEGSYGIVSDAVRKMTAGEHAEVQYPWHHPDGKIMIVRCGGVKNPDYIKGVRIEGTHQDVTGVTHFDEETLKRVKQQAFDLMFSRLRADTLAFIVDHKGDVKQYLDFFGERILVLTRSDQVIYRSVSGQTLVFNAPGISVVNPDVCSGCPFSSIDESFYDEGTGIINDLRDGFKGLYAPENCPVKSSLMHLVYCNGKLVGRLCFHYLKEYHTFTEAERDMCKVFAYYLGLLIGRMESVEFERQAKELDSANRSKTLFLNSMSHDIRTPMNAIIGYVSMAEKYIDDKEKVLDYLDKINIAGSNLLQLVNQVLDMSRIESGSVILSDDPCDIITKAYELCEIAENSASTKNIKLSLVFDNVTDRYVIADAGRVNQVVMNVLGNAIKYTPEGGHVIYSISQIPCDRPGYGKYLFSFKDDGIGMGEEYVRTIFEPFSREKTSTVSRIQGTGLGMSIVKKLVDLMAGEISIESAVGAGTKIEITLSFRLDDQERDPSSGATVSDSSFTVLRDKRVLLVEDNEMNREISIMLLEEQGMVVDTAEDGDIAVAKMQAVADRQDWDHYDFVLMDIQMPRMNGYDAARAIRAIPCPADVHIPILAMTANAFMEDRQLALDAGMDEHIAKPIDVQNLWETLAKFSV